MYLCGMEDFRLFKNHRYYTFYTLHLLDNCNNVSYGISTVFSPYQTITIRCKYFSYHMNFSKFFITKPIEKHSHLITNLQDQGTGEQINRVNKVHYTKCNICILDQLVIIDALMIII